MSNLPENLSYGNQAPTPSTISLKPPSGAPTAPATPPIAPTAMPRLGLPPVSNLQNILQPPSAATTVSPASSQPVFGVSPTIPATGTGEISQGASQSLFDRFKNLNTASVGFPNNTTSPSSIAAKLKTPKTTLFQQDNIIPTWLGGNDSPDNKQSLFWNDADQKKSVDAVVKTLYDNKVLGDKEALANAISWKDKDVNDVPTSAIDTNGNVPLDLAKKIMDKWKNPNPVTVSSVLAEVPGAIETVSSKVMPPMLYDFGKGLLHAFSLGYINPGETDYSKFTMGGVATTDLDKTLGGISRFGGDVAGNLFMLAALKGGAVAGLAKLAGPEAMATLAKTGEATNLATKAYRVMSAAPAAQTFWTTLKDGSTALKATQAIMKPILGDVALFNLIGQISKQEPGTSRLARVFQDTANAVALNLAPKGVKGSLYAAFTGYVTTYTVTGDEKAALENGVLFGALHGLSSLHPGSGAASFETLARDNALDQANAIRAPYVERAGRSLVDMPAVKATPETTAKLRAQLNQEFSIASDELYKQAEREGWDPQKFNTEQKKLILSYKFLQGEAEITKAGRFSRAQETNWEKLNIPEADSKVPPEMNRPLTYSMASYAKPNLDEFGLGERPTPLPDVTTSDVANKQFPYFRKIQLTGYGSRVDPATGNRIPIDPITRQNIIDYNNHAQLSGETPPIYISTEPEGKYYIEKHNGTVTPEDIKNGTKQVYDPHDSLVAFYFDPASKQFKRLGYVPTESYVGKTISGDGGKTTIEGMKYNQNQVIDAKNKARIEQGLPPFEYLDSNENNHTLRQAMDQNGIHVLKVRAEMPQDFGNGVGIGLDSNEPYLHVATTDNFWKEAALRNADINWNDSRWYNRQVLDSIQKMKDYTTPPVEKLKQMPAVDRGDTPLNTDFQNADKIIKARSGIIDFADNLVEALKKGHPQEVKSVVDKYVGTEVISLHDAKSMISAKEDLTLSDLLPTNTKVMSLLQQAYNEGKLNASGQKLIQSFRFISKNDYEFFRNWESLKDRSLLTNKPVDPAAPIAQQVTQARVNDLTKRMSESPLKPVQDKIPLDTAAPLTESSPAPSAAPVEVQPSKASYTTDEIMAAQREAQSKREAPPATTAAVEVKVPEKPVVDTPAFTETATLPKEVKVTQIAAPESAADGGYPLANKLPKRKLASYESVNSLLNIPEDELNTPSSWSENTNGVLKRPYNEITKVQQEALKNGDTETAAKLQETKGKFSKAYLELKAKDLYRKSGGDAGAAFTKFKDDLNSYFKSISGKDIVTDYADSQDLKHQFNRMVDAIPTQSFSLGEKGFKVADDSPAVASMGDDLIRHYEIQNKLKPGSLQIVSADTGSSKFDAGASAAEKVDALRKAAAEKDYIIFGTKNTGLDSLVGVKYHPDLVDRFNENPEKYKFTTDKGPIEGNDEKFFRVFVHDVLGLPNNLSADGVAKRWNLIFSREVTDKSAPTTIVKRVLPSPKVADFGGVDNGDLKHLTGIPEDLVKAVNDKSVADGKKYITQERAKEISEANGFPAEKQHFKSTTYHTFKGEDGSPQAFIEKGDTAVMTPALKKYFEDLYGIKIAKNDEITFSDNVKIGKDIGKVSPTKLGDERIVEVPNTSMSYKFVSEPSAESRFSPSTLGKFSAKDNVNQEFVNSYKPTADKFKQMVEDVHGAGNNLDEVFKKYGIDFSDNLFGAKKDLVRLGAGPKYMQKDVENTLLQNFQDRAMDMTDFKSGHMYSSPDWGYKDGETTKYLKPGEVMISAEKAKELGVGEGDSVLTWRNPVSRKTAMYKAKVLVGENHGIDYLGRDHAIPSSHDIYIRLEGDHDGDTLNFMKIGGKDGLPEKIANVVEAQRAKEGDIVLPPLTAFPKQPLTIKNLSDIVKNQLMGSEGIGVTAANARAANMMVDNKVTVKFTAPNAAGKTFYTVFRGDHPVDSSSIPPGENGAPATKNKAPVTVSFNFDPDRQYLYTRTLQEAVDAIKSPDLANRGFDKDYLLNHSLNVDGPGAASVTKTDTPPGQGGMPTVTDPKIAKVLGREMQKLQNIYYVTNPSSGAFPKTMADLISKLDAFNKQSDFAVAGGTQLSPVQDVAKLFDGMKYESMKRSTPGEVDGKKVNIIDADKNARWRSAADAVKSELGDKMAEPLASEPVQKFIDKAAKAKTEYNLYRPGKTDVQRKTARADARSSLIQYYYENEKNYTPEQKDAIVYYLVTDPGGNIANEHPGRVDFKGVQDLHKNVYLYDELLPASPTVAKAFFKNFEK